MTLSEECGEEDSMEGTLPKEMLGSSGAAVGAESADGAFEILAAQEIPLPVVGGTEWAGAEEAVLCYGGEGEEGDKGRRERTKEGKSASRLNLCSGFGGGAVLRPFPVAEDLDVRGSLPLPPPLAPLKLLLLSFWE
jgi:hypothetical protein